MVNSPVPNDEDCTTNRRALELHRLYRSLRGDEESTQSCNKAIQEVQINGLLKSPRTGLERHYMIVLLVTLVVQ